MHNIVYLGSTILWNYLVGIQFRGLTTLDMFVNTWIREFQIICNITKVKNYFVGILNSWIFHTHEIKRSTKINDFTVAVYSHTAVLSKRPRSFSRNVWRGKTIVNDLMKTHWKLFEDLFIVQIIQFGGKDLWHSKK